MNIYLIIILTILLVDYVLDFIVDHLNIKNIDPNLPPEFAGYYDAAKYRRSQEYLKENTNFGLFTNTFFTVITILFVLLGGFNLVDLVARHFRQSEIITGLIFAAIMIFGSQVLSLPFSVYGTFVIEEKYGFNRTTVKTFILDILKSWLLTALIGGAAFALVIWFFARSGAWAWVYCWLALTVFELFITFIAPVVIMPLFNKFIPLPEGELRSAIEDYARKQGFKMKGIFTMDGSRRSSKSNAFFTGFGRFRRIVLFDTLIEKHMIVELVTVLAHEIGHYKKKHIFKQILLSLTISAIMLFILSRFINNPGLFQAFRMQEISIYASLFFFGFLFSPLNLFFSILGNQLSRRYEYEADAYAVSTAGQPEAMITALKKLTVDNLGNLTPHPLNVFLHYTHPPVLERIKAIRKLSAKP